jgi:hypothetical protein
MKPPLHPVQPPRYRLESRDRHLVHGLRAALAVAVVLAVFGTLVLVVATQVVADSPSGLSTAPDPAGPAALPGA